MPRTSAAVNKYAIPPSADRTRRVSAGANVKAVQRMLGHASAAVTLDVYADLFDDDLAQVATALDHRAMQTNVANLLPRRP